MKKKILCNLSKINNAINNTTHHNKQDWTTQYISTLSKSNIKKLMYQSLNQTYQALISSNVWMKY